MKNGVPFHTAFGLTAREAKALVLDREERAAFAIVLSELEGAEFDWRAMRFRERK